MFTERNFVINVCVVCATGNWCVMCWVLVLSYRLNSHTIELSLGKTNSGFNKPHVLVADKDMRSTRMDVKNYGKNAESALRRTTAEASSGIGCTLDTKDSGFNKPHVLVTDKDMRSARMDEDNCGKKAESALRSTTAEASSARGCAPDTKDSFNKPDAVVWTSGRSVSLFCNILKALFVFCDCHLIIPYFRIKSEPRGEIKCSHDAR